MLKATWAHKVFLEHKEIKATEARPELSRPCRRPYRKGIREKPVPRDLPARRVDKATRVTLDVRDSKEHLALTGIGD